jgi:hypothetical protein
MACCSTVRKQKGNKRKKKGKQCINSLFVILIKRQNVTEDTKFYLIQRITAGNKRENSAFFPYFSLPVFRCFLGLCGKKESKCNFNTTKDSHATPSLSLSSLNGSLGNALKTCIRRSLGSKIATIRTHVGVYNLDGVEIIPIKIWQLQESWN